MFVSSSVHILQFSFEAGRKQGQQIQVLWKLWQFAMTFLYLQKIPRTAILGELENR